MTDFINDDLNKALEGLILSPSGWRAVFAADGNEESATGDIAAAHRIIIRRAATVFARYLQAHNTRERRPRAVVGMDTRPTGPAIAEGFVGGLLAAGCDVEFAGVVAAPEIMAYAKRGGVDGFVYISASHNPIGHNGLKFGLADGGVLSTPEAKQLIADFHANHDADEAITHVRDNNGLDVRYHAGIWGGAAYTEALSKQAACKQAAYQAYLEFTREVVQGNGGKTAVSADADILSAIAAGLRTHPVGIAVDFNGSARTVSIDREFFESLGITLHAINDKPGAIAHRIVPEGESLEPCRQFLEKLHAQDPSVVLGYVPDCDGDRGNLVIWDEGAQQARILEAQEVFALACVGEFAHLVWNGELCYDSAGKTRSQAAIAVNDPTSMRVDRIAKAFGISVFHAEVGEANVVGLARTLRERGFLVRILGEGSAGGNITHPAAVRDPLNTVMAIIKLLCARSGADKPGLFEIWRTRSGQKYRDDFSLADIIASLPVFHTTGSYTPEAILRVKSADHAVLKTRYQAVFLREWQTRKAELQARYGLTQWEASCYNGMEEKRGLSHFGEAGRGGLKITFTDKEGNETAWIWMRGSGTEPVFRVMADSEVRNSHSAAPPLERELIEWQRRMVIEADATGAV
ncbi:MAG: phosphatidylglycerol lysyltransferase [Treponema sp.]|nr:phosphatidylglycerol lysyltransferase [Treponema sp.]